MNTKNEMAKERAVIDYIVKNRLSKEKSEQYMKEQGVVIPTISFSRATDPDEWEAGQRFVDLGNNDDQEK